MGTALMIAFDLDGIFISDVKYINPKEFDLFNRVKMNMLGPIFNLPKGTEFCIITGRTVDLKEQTLKWLKRHRINPQFLYHDNYKEPAELYKLKVISEDKNITTFIESSKSQVNFLNSRIEVSHCRVLHFGTFIQNALAKL